MQLAGLVTAWQEAVEVARHGKWRQTGVRGRIAFTEVRLEVVLLLKLQLKSSPPILVVYSRISVLFGFSKEKYCIIKMPNEVCCALCI